MKTKTLSIINISLFKVLRLKMLAVFRIPSTPATIILLLTTLSACSANPDIPLETRYYLLNNHNVNQSAKNAETNDANVKNIAKQHSNNTSAKNKKIVNVKVLDLPDYLQQPHLIMQLDQHQIHYARFDMWAEPLKIAFHKALVADLNKNNDNIQFMVKSAQERDVADLHHDALVVRIDSFHPTSTSIVILSGVFWQESANQNSKNNPNNRPHHQPIAQQFSLQLTLQQDGYSHAVSQMRQLVTMVAEDILDAVIK